MRVMVIFGENSTQLVSKTNQWLSDNESKFLITSISPAMPCGKEGGAYITIVYVDNVDNVFDEVG
jgi:hypothetical protein